VLVAWLVIPFGLAFARSLVAAPILNHRNLIIGLPAAFVLFARAICVALPRPALQFAAAGLFAAAMIQGIFVTGAYYTFPRKNQFREAAALLAAHEASYPDSRVVAHAFGKSYFDYYLERSGATRRVDLLAGSAADIDALRSYLERERPLHLWVLEGHRRLDPAMRDYLDAELEPVAYQALFGASVTLYRVGSDDGAGPADAH
jgi:hypothetical protein